MNKKFLFGMFAALTMLFATSCQNDELDSVLSGNESVVSFTLEQPGIATRAYSDGTTATNLSYAVYETGVTPLKPIITSKEEVTFNGKTATVDFRLVTGKTYDIIFWADAPASPYTFNEGDQTITVDYTDAVCNDEDRDAFFAVKKSLLVNGSLNEKVELTRSFAQLNIGNTDAGELSVKDFAPAKTSVKVSKVYSTLNLFDGTVSGESSEAQLFDFAAIPSSETFPVDNVNYLSINYLLIGSDKELVDVEFSVSDDADTHTVTRKYTSVPVQRNYRTNLYGKILTDATAYNLEIKADYSAGFDYEVSVWDGVSATVFTAEQLAADVIEINSAADLAGISKLSNDKENINNFAGKTIKLNTNIDLGNKNWMPISPNTGDKAHHFRGTFDGGDYTITGLKIEADKDGVGTWGVGFIGGTQTNAIVKNVHIVGCDVAHAGGQKIGALIGWNYGGTVENCSLTAGESAKLYGKSRDVGGLVGLNENGGTVKNCVVNGPVKVSTSSTSVGALVGRNYSTIEGCSVINENTEKVEIYSTVKLPETWDGTSKTGFYVGGISGANSGEIKNCTVEGNIELRGMQYVGGITADYGNKELSGCTVEGVAICANFLGGGLIGFASQTVVSDCHVADVTLNTWSENFENGDGTVLPFIGFSNGITLSGENTVDGAPVENSAN